MLPDIINKSNSNTKGFIKDSIESNNISLGSEKDSELESYLKEISKYSNNTKIIRKLKSKEGIKRLVPKVSEDKIDENNMFGLSESEQNIVRTSIIKTPKGERKLDDIIKLSSGGVIGSLSALIFEGRSFLGKNSIALFKENISKYSDQLLGIITKIVKHVWNLIKTKAQEFTGNVSEKWESVKSSVIKGLDNLLKIEDKTAINKKSNIPGTGSSIIESVKSLFLIMGGDKKYSEKLKKESKINPKDKKVNSLSDSIYGATTSEVSGAISDSYNNDDSTPIPMSKSLSTTAGMRLAIYSGLRKAGFSDKQSRILTAEIGREGSFNPNNVFGVHGDPANKVSNIGMISWQGDRNPKLVQWMKSAGLFKNGKMVRNQQSIDMQAKFIMHEIVNNPRFARTKKIFLANRNVDYNVGTEVLGTNYIAWRYHDKKYARGHRNRNEAYAAINKQLEHGAGDADFSSLEQKQNMMIERDKKKDSLLIYKSPKNINIAQPNITNQINTNMSESIPDIQHKSSPKDYSHKMDGNLNTINNNASIATDTERTYMPSFFEMLIQKDITGNMLG